MFEEIIIDTVKVAIYLGMVAGFVLIGVCWWRG
jgi:hypothetical protein